MKLHADDKVIIAKSNNMIRQQRTIQDVLLCVWLSMKTKIVSFGTKQTLKDIWILDSLLQFYMRFLNTNIRELYFTQDFWKFNNSRHSSHSKPNNV